MNFASVATDNPAPVLYLPHGGGPMPLLGEASHASLASFLRSAGSLLGRPNAIVLVSAHWEQIRPAITGAEHPELLHDYFAFTGENYSIQYPAAGAPELANRIRALLHEAGIESDIEEQRGFDHGMFVPMKLMFPRADIPCVQVSLARHLNPEFHINLGRALSPLKHSGIAIVGSGLSFHNARTMRQNDNQQAIEASEEFNDWLVETCCDPRLDNVERRQRLRHWESGPFARYCHPREEHLLPLHVCFGAAGEEAAPAELVYRDHLWNKTTCALYWP